jgi:hypothetical protein
MGLYHKGIPYDRALRIANGRGITTLVETGTQVARTAVWAARYFRKVVTIEVDQGYFEGSVKRYGHLNNIQFIHGDSAEKLLDIMPTLREPALFWLDAHWSRDLKYKRPEVICPVMAEIAAINHYEDPGHVILIDDARLFLGENSWPTQGSVISALQEGKNRHVAIEEDVIFAWPGGNKNMEGKAYA